MRNNCLCFIFVALVALLLTSCGESKHDLFIGKWDMTEDTSGYFHKTLELKEDNVFIETWIVLSDDREEEYVLEIQGEYFFMETEGIGKALCFIYYLESLSDPHGILQYFDDENHFSEENKKYHEAKKQGKVYGLQGVAATPTRLYFEIEVEKSGHKFKEDHEFPRIKDDEEKSRDTTGT